MAPARFPHLLERGGPDEVARLDPSRALLAFHRPYERQVVERALAAAGLRVEDEVPGGGAVNHTARRLWVRAADGEIGDGELDRLADSLGDELAWIGPVYEPPAEGRDGAEPADRYCPCPDAVLVRFDDATDRSADRRHAVAGPLGLVEDADDQAVADRVGPGGFRRYRLADAAAVRRGSAAATTATGDGPPADAYEAARRLRALEAAGPAEVRFESMPMRLPYTMQGIDPLSDKQWNMIRIKAASPVANQISGWDYSTGDSSVVVAVLDTGCDLTHPDLRLAQGLSINDREGHGATTDVPNFAAGHGTLCAGVVAAVANNLKGLQGVAGRCVILPVAFDNCTDWEFLTGLTWAVDQGAKVVSMSFTIYSGWDMAVAGQAVTYAAKKDVVLCAASGNDNRSTVGYPANDDRVIAVGASTHAGPEERIAKGTTYSWGSNYGTNLSVVAPGIDVPTTCVQGSGDGGEWGADYVSGFFGTSAATPHVAGLAALIRSVRPGLDAAAVRRLIESTADKIGSDRFDVRQTNGSWNKYVGYGRINARWALRRAIWPLDLVVDLQRHLIWLQMAVKAHQIEIGRLEDEGGDPLRVEVHRELIRLAGQDALPRLLSRVADNPELLDELAAEVMTDTAGGARRWGIELPPGAEVLVEGGGVNDAGAAPTLEVRFTVAGCPVRAGWDAATGFFGEVDPRALVRARRAASRPAGS